MPVSAMQNRFERLVRVEHGEWPKLLLAFAYFFFLLGGYFMLRPVRGTVAANNSDLLHWLYTATFVSMLLLVPVFGFLVSRFRRGRFIPGIYLFFIANLMLFAFGFEDEATPQWIQRAFYVWLSVFNLFVVSIFWSFMADIFRPGQATRLFGFIMAGGSIGAMLAPSVTRLIVGMHLPRRVTPLPKNLQERGVLALPAGPARFQPVGVAQRDGLIQQVHRLSTGVEGSRSSRRSDSAMAADTATRQSAAEYRRRLARVFSASRCSADRDSASARSRPASR